MDAIHCAELSLDETFPSTDGFKEHPKHLPQTPLHRAASIVRAAMLFREQYKLGQVPPEKTKEGSICMDTWRYVFSVVSETPSTELITLQDGCLTVVAYPDPRLIGA